MSYSLHNRAGNLSDTTFDRVSHQGHITCILSFKDNIDRMASASPMIMPDGRVVLCCNDYAMKHTLGNLITQSWNEIKQGNEYRRVEKGLKEESDILCRTCSFAFSTEILPAVQWRHILTNKKTPKGSKAKEIARQLQSASQIAIMGQGGMFRDQYLPYLWNETFNASLFVDNASEKWGRPIPGLENHSVQNPTVLRNFPNIVVVTFVKDGRIMAQQLDDLGIRHVNIFEFIESL